MHPGTRIGPYEITIPLGSGGMGEVFRAHDTRLNRDVAVKVLSKNLVADAARLQRFEQESRTLAALNHPNILTIHDAGVHDGMPYLVSELLEGNTLREEMNGGALPVRKATEYALQIAHGLAAAHSKGIIHRDLKPENIFLTKDGRAKILDFGLAKLRQVGRDVLTAPLDSGNAPDDSLGRATPTVRIDPAPAINTTEPGLVMGTPAYMSPEQVRGEPADHRSDIFAFGCVLYEMLSGTRVFRRNTPVESMNAILSEEPPELAAINVSISPALERVVGRCLDKQSDNRFQSATDLAFAIEVAADGRSTRTGIAARQSPPQTKRLVATLLLLLLAFGGGTVASKLWSPARITAAPSIRYLTYSGRDYSPAAEADGKRVCFASDRTGTKRIWIKELTSGSESSLTSGPDDFPRFSRDGSTVLFTRAFGSKRALFRVPSIGGEPSKVADDALSGDWSPDGRQITFVRWSDQGDSSIHVVGVDGSGETVLHRSEVRGSSPRWSPDGKTIAVAINDYGRPQSVVLIDVDTRRAKSFPAPNPYNTLSTLAWDSASQSVYYMQADSSSALRGTGALFRQSSRSGKFQKLLWISTHCAVMDLLPSGNVLIDARSSRENLQELSLASGTAPPTPLTRGNSTDRQPAYSPDGNEIVFSSNRSGNLEIWSLSRKTGLVRPLTHHPADDWDPAFSPDGKYLLWSANRTGNLELYIANADGTAPRQVTHEGFAAENPTMTRDGRWIVYSSASPRKAGLWKIRPDGSSATHLIQSQTAGNAEVSPDGRYAAFVDNRRGSLVVIRVIEVESGTVVPFEIRVEGIKETVAILGRVRWMPDGKSLLFLGQNEDGVLGLYLQDFVPGQDTTNTRRPLGPFDSENSVESFGISPDGQFVTIATWEQFFSIMMTEDLPSL